MFHNAVDQACAKRESVHSNWRRCFQTKNGFGDAQAKPTHTSTHCGCAGLEFAGDREVETATEVTTSSDAGYVSLSESCSWHGDGINDAADDTRAVGWPRAP